jgi:uncharacterized repeat protein (TIGR01451 family)
MLDRTALSRRSLFTALGLAVLVVVAAIALGRTAPVSAQGPFTISKAADVTSVNPGDRVTYTITFTNIGTAGAATMTDVIPFGVNYVSGSATGGAAYSVGRVTWSGTVGSGVTVVVTFQVDVVEPGTLGPLPIVNEARVCYDGTCTWSNPVTIYSVSIPIVKAADATDVNPGDRVTYTITFTNTGTASLPVTMVDIIPFGVNYVSGSATGGATYSAGRVNWSGTVNPGQTVVVTFQVDVVEPSTLGPFPIPNRARLCSGGSCVWSNTVTIYSSRVRAVYLPIITRNWEYRPPWPWIQPGGRR